MVAFCGLLSAEPLPLVSDAVLSFSEFVKPFTVTFPPDQYDSSERSLIREGSDEQEPVSIVELILLARKYAVLLRD